MSEDDAKTAIHQNIPQISDVEIDAVTALVKKQPDGGTLKAMLGLDGEKVTVHKAQNLRGIYA